MVISGQDLAGDADADDEWSRLLHPLDCCVVGVGDPVGLRVELGESGVAARRRRAPLDPPDPFLAFQFGRVLIGTDLGHLTPAAAFGQMPFYGGDGGVGGLLALCPHGDHEVIRTHVRVAVEVIAVPPRDDDEAERISHADGHMRDALVRAHLV